MQRVFGIALLLAGTAYAQAPSTKAQKLVALQRLTVGPNDNFQGAVDEGETVLFYTRSENLSSQIMRLDLKTGISAPVTDVDADAKSPTLNPDGKRLAINYFKQDAKGDICLLEEKAINCISTRGVVDHSPVWIGNERLAYVSSDDTGKQSQLKVYDLGTKKTDVLFKGELYAPDLAPDGRTLVYKGKQNELVLYDIGSRKIMRTIQVDLPGITGPARFSADGRFVYIAQYMLDSNRDLQFDSRDAAAIFRFDLDSTTASPPMQITSLKQNCSYPYPASRALYMTCAFEGALDIYRGPLTGTVPAEWQSADMQEAHQVARSYFDRVLFLNQLHTRFGVLNEKEFQERSFQNFLYAVELLPAEHYVRRLSEKAPNDKSLKALQILLLSWSRWELMPEKRNLGAFAQFIGQQRKALDALGDGIEQQITHSYLDLFSGAPQKADQRNAKIQPQSALQVYLLAQNQRLLPGSRERYKQFLADRILIRDGTEENRLYFLSLWLEEQALAGDPTPALNALKPKVKGSMLEILDNELELYKLSKLAPGDNADIKIIQGMVERVKRLKDQYYPLRLLFNRSIIVMTRSKRNRDVSAIVSLWVSYLNRASKEYPYAMEAMRQNSLDLAYQFSNGPEAERKFAIGSFYNSIRSADDLESHYQYALLNFPKWEALQTNYSGMLQQGLIQKESLDFVNAVHAIMSNPDKVEADDLAKAAETVAAIRDEHIGIGQKYLFLGYLYQRQMLLAKKKAGGFDFDRDLADKAHRAYLFAIDGAFNNDRLQASALQNLGLLHLSLRNPSLAAEFFSQRTLMGYASTEEQRGVLWLKAHALYLSNRPAEALAAMEAALKLEPKPLQPFQEKAAFYAWNAGQYEKSAGYYASFAAAEKRPSILLSYGYALHKAGRSDAALQQWERVLAATQGSPVKDGDAPALILQPLKLHFITQGLIAQAKSLPVDRRVKAFRQRQELFPTMIEQSKVLHFQPEALSAQRIKELEDLAMLLAENAQNGPAEQAFKQAMQQAEEHGKAYGYLNHVLMTALKNAWLFSAEKKLGQGTWQAEARRLVDFVDKEYFEQKTFTPLVTQKWAEFKLIQHAFGEPSQEFRAKAEKLLASKEIQAMQAAKPELYVNLALYRDAMARKL